LASLRPQSAIAARDAASRALGGHVGLGDAGQAIAGVVDVVFVEQ
jgi:hypothetical protein